MMSTSSLACLARLRNAEAHFVEAIDPEAHRIPRVHELCRYDAAGHNDCTPREQLATLRQHVGQPHERIKRMAHDIAPIPHTNTGSLDQHRAMHRRKVNGP